MIKPAIDIVSVTKVYPHRTDPVTALNDISFVLQSLNVEAFETIYLQKCSDQQPGQNLL